MSASSTNNATSSPSLPSSSPSHCSVFVCADCQNFLFRCDQILNDQATVLGKAVYSYKLDLLCSDNSAPNSTSHLGGDEEDKPTPCRAGEYWVYSATNPSAKRFDVVRVRSDPLVSCQVVRCPSPFDGEHSWFPPYEWCMCLCGACGGHLGWGFSLPPPHDPSLAAAAASPPTAITTTTVSSERLKRKRPRTTSGSDAASESNHQPETGALPSPPPQLQQGQDEQEEQHVDTTTNSAAAMVAESSDGEEDPADGDESNGDDEDDWEDVGDDEDDDEESSNDDDDGDDVTSAERQPAFLGIIVTSCRLREDFTEADYQQAIATAPQRAEQYLADFRLQKDVFQRLRRMPDQLQANQLAMQFAGLREASLETRRRSLELMSSFLQLLDATRGLRVPESGDEPSESAGEPNA